MRFCTTRYAGNSGITCRCLGLTGCGGRIVDTGSPPGDVQCRLYPDRRRCDPELLEAVPPAGGLLSEHPRPAARAPRSRPVGEARGHRLHRRHRHEPPPPFPRSTLLLLLLLLADYSSLQTEKRSSASATRASAASSSPSPSWPSLRSARASTRTAACPSCSTAGRTARSSWRMSCTSA